MTREMMSNDQAEQAACDAVHSAAKSSRFMVAVWKVESDRVELVNVTTWQFLVGDFLPAVGQLALNRHEEVMQQQKTAPPTSPLPRFPMRLNQPPRFGLVKKDGEEKDVEGTHKPAPDTVVEPDSQEGQP